MNNLNPPTVAEKINDRIFRTGLYGGFPDKHRYKGGMSTAPNWTKGQGELFDQLTDMLGGQLGAGIPGYEGDTVAPLTGMEQRGMDYFGGMTPIGASTMDYMQGALNLADPATSQEYLTKAGGALDTMLQDFNPQDTIDLFNQSVRPEAMRTFEQDILPMIQEKYISGGQSRSGALDRAFARSGEDLTSGLSGQLAQMIYGDKQSHLGRQQTAINQGMNMAGLPGDLISQAMGIGGTGADFVGKMLDVGGMERAYDQDVIGDLLSKWEQSQPYNNPWLRYLPTALNATPYGQPYQSQSALSSLMPGIGLGLGGMMSGGGLSSIGSSLFGSAAVPGMFGSSSALLGATPATSGILGSGGLGATMSGLGSGLGSMVSGAGTGALGLLSLI